MIYEDEQEIDKICREFGIVTRSNKYIDNNCIIDGKECESYKEDKFDLEFLMKKTDILFDEQIYFKFFNIR